ncbi:hypothetical protein TcYC6_0027150 [Trypanosoma cruzi]|uniref:PX domain-containing protein n=1 Tax=Trypanosoma cruzi (strain CL Brener) TaxID=353153 RepID=Q4D7E0_TRYCC|nr:hypothetical protein Tc00.1047053510407.70 [Trypanosoma cruzi]EAN88442.1 hypothetical protein Tc00.1047053510407.70 [Trypanosoma cruzi]KAF8286402.1 hypothetical protein TcYC6_0027150 [Trypanosoma cruzi]RNC58018.1 hypothetical protein TcCL_ESM04377 [Trypanosoma cruzi]|eukprot:XP_810293.1 hypothetical protein [Trypanosoma cruzi strain CL Brener]
MSKWASVPGENDEFGERNEGSGTLFSCSYVVHIPPPVSGPSLPANAIDIVSITLPHVRLAPDVTQKMVTWYEVLVRSATHQWSVLKRFSEFVELYKAMEKANLLQLARQQLERALAAPPSRFFPSQRRQQRLEEFVQSLLQTMKDLLVSLLCSGSPETEVVGDFSRQTASLVTGSAFSIFIRFLTTTSYNALLVSALAGRDSTAHMTSGATTDCLMMDERTHVPPAKIIHLPKQRFTIMLQLPGVSISAVFVECSEDSREIVVKGAWNNHINGPDSVLSGKIDTLRNLSVTSSGGLAETVLSTDLCAMADTTKVLVDTFPVGDFQMEFEVPPPFAVREWESQYAGGVLFLTWRSDAFNVSNPTKNT